MRGILERYWGSFHLVIAIIVFSGVSLIDIAMLRTPPVLADALDYFSTAQLLPEVTPTHRHLRIGMIWPLWALIQSVGYVEAAYYLLPWLACFLLGLSTWRLGRSLFCARVGWAGGLVVMLLPPYATHVSMLLPDYLSVGLFTLGVAAVCHASCRRWRAGIPVQLLLFGAGVLVGWSYLVREFVAVFFPCLGVAMLLLRVPVRGWVSFCLGALLVYGLEPLWGWLVYGDPFIRLSVAGGPRDTRLPLSMDVVDVLLQFPTRFLGRAGGEALAGFMVFGLVAAGVGAVRGGRSWRVLAVWALPGWAFFTVIALLPILMLGEGSTYLRMHLFRYWAMILPPVVLGAVAGVFAIHDWLLRRGVGGRVVPSAVLALLLAVPAWGVALGLKQLSAHPGLVRNSADYQEFREFVASGALPPLIWMDSATTVSADKSLPMYMRSWAGGETYWDGEVRALNSSRNDWVARPEVKGGYVMMDRSRSDRIFSRATPDYFRSPESVWQVVFRSSSSRILVLDPSRPAPLAQAVVSVPPETMQVNAVEGEVHHESVRGGGLHVRVGSPGRAVLTDAVAKGLRPPPPGRNRLPTIDSDRIMGSVVLERKDSSDAALSVRCLFFDKAGDRRAPWARLVEPLPERGGRERYGFSCAMPPAPFTAMSARLLVQLSAGSDVVLHEANYGFAVEP